MPANAIYFNRMPAGRLGRPKLYDDSIKDLILERLSQGQMLNSICAEDGMPSVPHVMRWILDDSTFRESYSRARITGYDIMAENIVSIADNMLEDPRSRAVRIDARKWILSKLRPEQYGDQGLLSGLSAAAGAGGSGKLTIEFVRPTEQLLIETKVMDVTPLVIDALPFDDDVED